MTITQKLTNEQTAYKFIQKVGNLKFYYKQNAPRDITLYAINGTDIVAQEVYFTDVPADAVRRMLNTMFDTYTMADIRAGIPQVKIECPGLVSGKIAGFDSVEYFKHTDDTPYYKHFTHRPMM